MAPSLLIAAFPRSKVAAEHRGRPSGRKIIDILKRNPTKDPDRYDQDDLAHMRK